MAEEDYPLSVTTGGRADSKNMSLTTQTRNTLASLMRRHPDCVRTIAYLGVASSGLVGPSLSTAALEVQGDKGRNVQMIRVDASTLARPVDGATIVVDGELCEVLTSRIDHTGALLVIDFLICKPVTKGTEP